MHNSLVPDEISLPQFTHAGEKITTKKMRLMVKKTK